MFEQINKLVSQIKHERPLILNMTNYVTMDFIANGLLSLGASPVMSKAEPEIEDLLTHAKSVVINIGTLNKEFIALCHHACKIANQLKKPIVLDPVGAGASQYRTGACLSLIDKFNISIIRGNASEVMALAGHTQKTKGVDSTIESENIVDDAKILSKQYDAAIVISGKKDIIIDNDLIVQLDRGSSLMPTITGTGCLLSAVIAAFFAIEKNRFEAAKIAVLFYGICGEIAEQKSYGPGSFKTKFLDALHFIPSRDQYEKK